MDSHKIGLSEREEKKRSILRRTCESQQVEQYAVGNNHANLARRAPEEGEPAPKTDFQRLAVGVGGMKNRTSRRRISPSK